MDDIFSQIEAERKSRKLTVGKLAEESGVSRQHYYSCKKGEKSPSIEWCRKLAAALGLELTLQKTTNPS